MKEKIKLELSRVYCTQTQSPNKDYKNYLDMVKGIAIILVVLGHSGTITFTVNTWLSTFHLPVFFVISGILLNLKHEIQAPIITILKNKIRHLFIPYICFSICTIFFLLINILAGTLNWDVLKQLVFQTLSLQGYSVMWFLPVLFFAELLVIILLKFFHLICKKKIYSCIYLCVVTTILAFCSYYCYNQIVITIVPVSIANEIKIFAKSILASAFISYGYLLSNLFCWIDTKKIPYKKFIGFSVGIILFSINFIVLPYTQLMDLNNLNVGKLYEYLLLGLNGTLGLIFICQSIPNIPVLSYYGQNSLIIMCSHLNFYVLYIGLVLGQFVAAHVPGDYLILWSLSSMIIMLIVEIPLIICIKVFFPFMLGKKKTFKIN